MINRAKPTLALHDDESALFEKFDCSLDGAFRVAAIDCDSLSVWDDVWKTPHEGDVHRLYRPTAIKRFEVAKGREDLIVNRRSKSIFRREAKLDTRQPYDRRIIPLLA